MGLKDRNEAKAAKMATKLHPGATLFAKGHNGQIAIEGDWLIIYRKGLGRAGHSKGDRRIPLKNITAVQMRPGGALANGFIRFSVPGTPELRGGLKDATRDENAVIFTKWQQEAFESIRAAIEAYIGGDRMVAPSQGSGSVADELAKLAQLRDSGVLTDAEFTEQKSRLLS